MADNYRHPAARHLLRAVDPAAVDRVERLVVQKRRRRVQRRLYGSVAMALIVCGVAIVTIVGPGRRAPVQTTLSKFVAMKDGQPLPSGWQIRSAAPTNLRLADNSAIALEEGTVLQLKHAEVDLLTWKMPIGSAEFSQHGRQARQHRVKSPHASITLLASRTRVSVTDKQTVVSAYRGRAIVEPTGQTTTIVLQAGESIRLPAVEPPPRTTDNVETEPAAATVKVRPDPSKQAPKRRVPFSRERPSRARSTTVERLRLRSAPLTDSQARPDVDAGLSTDVETSTVMPEAVAAQNGFDPVPEQATAAAVGLSAVDQAMRQERFGDAVVLLEAMLQSHPNADEVPFAAFTLGTVLADRLRRPRAARMAFERALASPNLPAALRSIAERRVEALEKALPSRPR